MRWTRQRADRHLAAAVLAPAALLLTLAAPARAAVLPTAVVAGPAAITGVGSGRCLDVDGAARTARTGVSIYDCHGGTNQAWTLTSAGELQVYDAATCLDVAGQDTTAP